MVSEAGEPRQVHPVIHHRAGVCGKPIDHSLSPLLHGTAYQALGLTDWSYDRAEVDEDSFLPHVARLDESWRGLSLTMPLKEVAFQACAEVSDLARVVGAINTLVRSAADGSWAGDNTDVHGIVAALSEAGVGRGGRAVVVGGGATARSALAALAEMGVSEAVLLVRREIRHKTEAVAQQLGISVQAAPLTALADAVDVVIGTVPPAAYPADFQLAPGEGGVVLDCVYGGGPSPLLAAAVLAGYAAVPGTEMLLHQAAAQVRLMTGHEPPVAEMRAALQAALPGQ